MKILPCLRISKIFGTSNIKIEGMKNGMWYIGIPQQFIDFPTCEVALIWYGNDLIANMYPES